MADGAVTAVRADLRRLYGLCLTEGFVDQCLQQQLSAQGTPTNHASLCPALFKYAVDQSFKGITEAVLPEQMRQMKEGVLPGLVCLQVVAVRNAAVPLAREASSSVSRGKGGGAGGRRLLVVTVSDGFTRAHCVEACPVPSLDPQNLIPGLKIVLRDARIVHGVVWLDARTVVSTHGRVAYLTETWRLKQETENQRLFAKSLQPGEEAPPPFLPFTQGYTGGVETAKRNAAKLLASGGWVWRVSIIAVSPYHAMSPSLHDTHPLLLHTHR